MLLDNFQRIYFRTGKPKVYLHLRINKVCLTFIGLAPERWKATQRIGWNTSSIQVKCFPQIVFTFLRFLSLCSKKTLSKQKHIKDNSKGRSQSLNDQTWHDMTWHDMTWHDWIFWAIHVGTFQNFEF